MKIEMSNRERILTLLNRGKPDRVPWFGDLDYWYHAAANRGDLPPQFKGNGYFKLNADLDLGFYLQGFGPYRQNNPQVTWIEKRDGNRLYRTLQTPVGDLVEIQQYLPLSSSWGIVKHLVQDEDDLLPFLTYARQMSFTKDYSEIIRRKPIIGDNGVVLCYTPRSPFMQLITTYTGVENLIYLLQDAPDQLAEILSVLEEKYDQASEIAVASSADCIMIPENLSSEVVGTRFYSEYLKPYESRWVRQIRQAGKFSFIHMDGTLKGLVRQVAETGFDVIEAVTPEPCGDISMQALINMIDGPTILWGGLPGAVFTGGFSETDFEAHTESIIRLMKGEPRFVLGVADQVPPDGLLKRVARVSELCRELGVY